MQLKPNKGRNVKMSLHVARQTFSRAREGIKSRRLIGRDTRQIKKRTETHRLTQYFHAQKVHRTFVKGLGASAMRAILARCKP